VDPGGEVETLLDGGLGSDQAEGDGIYSGQWTPSAAGTHTLTFPGGDIVTVNVATPAISVIPSSLDFGIVNVGSSADKNLTVKNVGGGILTGNASTNSPFTIVSGGSYNLSPDESQTVTVRFAPTSEETFLGNITFTGGGEASAAVSGTGIIPPPPPGLTLTFNGKLRDRVGKGETALSPDGSSDGTFTVTLEAGSGDRTVTSLDMTNSSGGRWDTIPANSFWVMGAANTLDDLLLNGSDGTVNFVVADGGSFNLFGSDLGDSHFNPGTSFTLTVNFADGSTATASAMVP